MFELLILAAVAIFLFSRLFSVIGKEKGAPPPVFRQPSEPERKPQPVLVKSDRDPELELEQLSGLERIARADASFNQRDFVKGAKAAYEMIVTAFAEGDRSTLSGLLTQDVFNDYDKAIKDRETSGADPVELMRLNEASIDKGDLKGSIAEVTVLFVAELSDGERVSRTRELWTFERDTNSRDPNWRLSDVSAA